MRLYALCLTLFYGPLHPSSCTSLLASCGLVLRRRAQHDCRWWLVPITASITGQHHRSGGGRGFSSSHQYGSSVAGTVDLFGGLPATIARLRLEAVSLGHCLWIGWMDGRMVAPAHRQQAVPRTAALAAFICCRHVRAQFPPGALASLALRRATLQYDPDHRHGGRERVCWLFRRRRRISGHGAVRILRSTRHPRNERVEST